MGNKKKEAKKLKKIARTFMEKIEQGMDAATIADLNTTSTLISRSLNMQLAQGLDEACGKGGDANVDINNKALEQSIKWCAMNGFKARDSATEELNERTETLKKVREEQRGFKLHAVGE